MPRLSKIARVSLAAAAAFAMTVSPADAVVPSKVLTELAEYSFKNADDAARAFTKVSQKYGDNAFTALYKARDETEVLFKTSLKKSIDEVSFGRLDYKHGSFINYGIDSAEDMAKLVRAHDAELPPEMVPTIRALMRRGVQLDAAKKLNGGTLPPNFAHTTKGEAALFDAWVKRMEALGGKSPVLSRRARSSDMYSGGNPTKYEYIMSNADSLAAHKKLADIRSGAYKLTEGEKDRMLVLASELDVATSYEKALLRAAYEKDDVLREAVARINAVATLRKKAASGAELADDEVDMLVNAIVQKREYSRQTTVLNEQLDSLITVAGRNPHVSKLVSDVQLANRVTANRSWLKLQDSEYQRLAEAIELGDKGTRTQKMMAATRGKDTFKESAEELEKVLRERFVARLKQGIAPRNAEEAKWLAEAAEAGGKRTPLQAEMTEAALKHVPDTESGKLVARLAGQEDLGRRLLRGDSLEPKDVAEVRRLGEKPTASLTEMDKRVLAAARQHKLTEGTMKELDLLRRLNDNGMVFGDDLRHVIDAVEAGPAGTPLQLRLAKAAEHNDAVKKGMSGLKASRGTSEAPKLTSHFDDLAAQTTKGMKAAGALFEDATERHLRVALSQGRLEAFAVLDELPVAAKALMEMPTPELLGLATKTLKAGKGVGPGLRDVAKAVKNKLPGRRTAAEREFLRAWKKEYPHGGAFNTPSGLIMGRQESEAALGLIQKLRKLEADGQLQHWARWDRNYQAPFDVEKVFTQVERDFIGQVYYGGKTTFNNKLRELMPKRLVDHARGGVNPFPTTQDMITARHIMSKRQGALKPGYEMSAETYARSMDPAAVQAGTLNPLPSAADVAAYTKEYSALKNKLEASVDNMRRNIKDEIMPEYIKGEDNLLRLRNTAEEGTLRRENFAPNQVLNEWRGELTSAQTSLLTEETRLANLMRMTPEQFATRFPPAGQMDSLRAAFRAGRTESADYAKRVLAEAKSNADAFEARVRHNLRTLDEELVARGVSKEGMAGARAQGSQKSVRELIKHEEAVVKEAMAQVKKLQSEADKFASPGMIDSLHLDNLDNPTKDAMLIYEKMSKVQARNDAILAAKRQIDDAVDRVAGHKLSAKQLDDYAAQSKNTMAKRAATLAERKAKWTSMSDDVSTRLEKAKEALPPAEQKLALYAEMADAAEKKAKYAAYVKGLTDEKNALIRVNAELKKLDDASFESFDKVDAVYDRVAKQYENLPAPTTL